MDGREVSEQALLRQNGWGVGESSTIKRSARMTYGLDFQIVIINQTDRSLDCSINGNRYRYYFDNQDFDNVERTTRLLMKSSPGKTLAWIKKNSTAWERILSS
jgi:hypothetical protein